MVLLIRTLDPKTTTQPINTQAYISTVGADYLKRDVVLRDGRPVRLQLWDIAGQDRFVHLTRAYFTRGKGGREGGREEKRTITG